ncbi:MAG: FGGY-family carbohydrate kinase [Alsobacter sp.]
MGGLFVGVDVGTGSARAGVFDARGGLKGVARHPLRLWHGGGGIVEQSTEDIWHACCEAVRGALARAEAGAGDVAGIAFDATCSMAVIDPAGRPLPVGPSGDPARNVIVWMDHRAVQQTHAINAGGHDVLRYVGGGLSPEMQPPKLLWLKTHQPATFRAAGHFFDLSDYLTFRATGSTARSVCTVVCKWTYLAHEQRWDTSFFRAIGLGEIVDEGFARLGTEIVAPGTPVASGLTAEAAAQLGLRPGAAVGASLIDAHAGALGTMGSLDPDGTPRDPATRLANIMGTSACLMAMSASAHFVPGIWGPYHAALLPGQWLNEGGQSAAGAAIDHLVRSHQAFAEASSEANEAGKSLLEFLEARVAARAPALGETAFAARGLHVLPDFLGNRSPFADPDTRGAVLGLDLDGSVESLERLYVAALCGLGYATAEVVEALSAHGMPTQTMVASGGAARSPLVRQIMADCTGLTVAVPETPEPVLLGSAMLAAVAAGRHASLAEAMPAMSRLAGSVTPTGDRRLQAFHRAKRRVFDGLRGIDRMAREEMRGIA